MLERLPTGRVRDRRTLTSVLGLHELLAYLRKRTFWGLVCLRGGDGEAALLVEAGDPVSALFEAGGTLVRGQEALRHVLRMVDGGLGEAEAVELPQPLVSLLRQMADAELVHRDLSTEFIRLPSLHDRLLREGFRGVVVVRGTGWWAFLPFPGGAQALYYDREAAGERERHALLSEIASLPAEIDVWARPGERGSAWASLRGDEVFLASPGLDPAELTAAAGPLGPEIVRLLDGTLNLVQVCEALGQPPAAVEPILLLLQRRRWIYRYIRRRRSEA